ncbi:hypothetical protein FACS1894174_08060 [Bacteroidia bacterium]|nr:hypothetical protein FACS1894174_08060 [Bacteroidia bacterium]
MMKDFTNHSKYLNPLTDFGFHKLFGTESCKELLIDFLNEVILERGRITDLEYLPSLHLGKKEKDRKAIFDIYCRNERGEYFIVEMQNAHQVYFKDRCIYYSTFPVQEQSLRGKDWKFKLAPVYTVAILDFKLFDNHPDYHHEVKLMNFRTKEVFSDKLTYFFLELPKFDKTLEELTTHFERWIYLLRYLPKLSDRPVELQGRVFDMLFRAAEIAQFTPIEMEKYNKSVLEYSDVRDAVEYARETGLEEGIGIGMEKGVKQGREEGFEKGIISIVRKCLEKNMPVEDIADLTGLSEEQILKEKRGKGRD